MSYVLTVFEPDARSLRDRYKTEDNLDRIYRRAGMTIRRWHEAGAFHRDLSIGNLLVRPSCPVLLIVDLDRALFFRRMGMLRRFRDLARVRVPQRSDLEFLAGYFGRVSGYQRLLIMLFRRIYRTKLAARRRLRVAFRR